MPFGSSISIFRKGITPRWEDKRNLDGGRWVVKIENQTPADTKSMWTNILISMIGESLEFASDINGAVLSRRTSDLGRNFTINVWTKSTVKEDREKDISSILKNTKPIIVYFQIHDSLRIRRPEEPPEHKPGVPHEDQDTLNRIETPVKIMYMPPYLRNRVNSDSALLKTRSRVDELDEDSLEPLVFPDLKDPESTCIVTSIDSRCNPPNDITPSAEAFEATEQKPIKTLDIDVMNSSVNEGLSLRTIGVSESPSKKSKKSKKKSHKTAAQDSMLVKKKPGKQFNYVLAIMLLIILMYIIILRQ